MKSTIKDVAALADVSFKTVSRVINGESSVKADTVKKVQVAIEQLNYQPNHAARSLAGTRSYTLGYVYDNPNAYYVIEMQNGILAECREQGYELVIHPCSANSDNIVEELEMMIKRSQLSGLILSPPLSDMPLVLDALNAMQLNFVRIASGSNQTKSVSPSVFINDHKAAYEITQHFISQGHKGIAFIGGDKSHCSSGERYKGYIQALKDHNLTLHSKYVVDGHYSFDSGVSGAKQLLALKAPPSAVFCCNDEIAAGALFAARLLSIDIPGQLAIAGFEDNPFSRQTWPKLTTAAQPTNKIARRAAALLISNIAEKRAHPKDNIEIKHEYFQPRIVIRESTLGNLGSE